METEGSWSLRVRWCVRIEALVVRRGPDRMPRSRGASDTPIPASRHIARKNMTIREVCDRGW